MSTRARVATALIIVLIVLLAAAAALRILGSRRLRLAVAAAGVSAAAYVAYWVARRFAPGPRAPAGAPARARFGGWPPGEDRVRVYGELLTAAEAAAVEAVAHTRLPMAALPARLADLEAGLPYRAAPLARRRALHNGQRKLLIAEVAFLAAHARDGDTVVYAGSAPGVHIPFLASLFHARGVRFALYDPRKFALPKGRKEALARITASRELFTDALAASFAGRDDVLFVSDVRGGDPTAPESEKTILADMRAQERWVRLMNPRAALLKFRPPYIYGAPAAPEDPFVYLAGEVVLQAWAPSASSETRLVAARPYASAPYDARAYGDRMYYLNTVLREWAFYEHGVSPALVPGLDHCFDCAAEARVWGEYLGRRSPAAVARLFGRASAALSRGLDRAPHGTHPDAFPADARKPG